MSDAMPASPRSPSHGAPAPAHGDAVPSPWIARHASLIEPRGRVLDLASGHGRHARLLARRGFRVLAVDRDAQALAALAGEPGIETRAIDVESSPWPFAPGEFDAVVVANYLHRPLFDAILASLAPAGTLIYETFAHGNEAYGRPRRPEFLLLPDELLDVVHNRMTVVAFEQGKIATARGIVVVQRIAAVGKARAWPPPLAAPRDDASVIRIG